MVYGGNFKMETMPQTVPTAVGFSPSFEYTAFQFDLSLLPDDYNSPNNTHNQMTLKPIQIKQEVLSPRPGSPTTYPSPPYPGLTGALSPNYSREASPGYPSSPYYVPQSPQSAHLYPTSPEPTATKPPVKREKSIDLLTILQESRLLAESLGYKEDSTDCTVPCTPPRSEEDIYNSLDTDFFPKREETSNPLLKEILFKEEPTSVNSPQSSISHQSSISSQSSPGPSPVETENSSLRSLLFPSNNKQDSVIRDNSSIDDNRHKTGLIIPKIEITEITDEETFTSQKITASPLNREDEIFKDQKSDHQLLREVLRDTSFQRKYNLRPVDLGNVGTGFVEDMENGECVGDLAREQIEPVLSLAIQQLQKDFDNTCVALGIHPEPRRWSAADVAAWVQWARRQLQLPSVPLDSFNIDGETLASLTEEDFCHRAPQCGSMLHAQLEIWKAAVEESPRNTLAASWSPAGAVQPSPVSTSDPNSSLSPPDASSSSASSCNMDLTDDEDDDVAAVTPVNEGGKIRNGGSHIHLWQFLKELLQSPGLHGSCIRWLDRTKGVFKIEDSVRVARLWGKRKNRPAMNYDKLSRSIRQYYKKGIMKKTERSQRLVYQFCHPYSL
ncbi:DNA-binding protein D-ETS-4 [Microplitis mediator]|uniref:DNA-binding protein D-ETS-4 n=1 Tax=Microplitis mediator TaxID=375433 RepID=UPI0025578E1C|nr:DNA-binding protein D-ETS-4 [Microplitis mediator]